jgi:lycopene cyclase domain-containing protein
VLSRADVLYLVVMAACIVGTLPLELALRARVYRRWRRLVLSLLPVLAVFLTWDSLSIHAGFWSYRNLSGLRVGNLPVEEIVFFLVIPTCAVLTFESVRRMRPSWFVGDEP